MAKIELGPLSQFLDDGEIKDLLKALKKVGVNDLPKSEEAGGKVADELDDDVWTDFLDRLEAEDVGADLYLPVEFDGVVEVAGLKVASTQVLIDILDDIKDDLDVDPDEDEEDDDDDGDGDDDHEEEEEEEDDEDPRLKEKLMKQVWKSLYTGAKSAIERELPLFVKAG
jgi:hypothetical protein